MTETILEGSDDYPKNVFFSISEKKVLKRWGVSFIIKLDYKNHFFIQNDSKRLEPSYSLWHIHYPL